jgi:tetratricopeptide (TPR) repeat protein
MEIHILQEGEHLGPFSEVQVRQYLGQGLVAPSDLATCEGMEDWQSLDLLLATLPPSARNPTMISPETTQIEPPASADQALEPEPTVTGDNAPSEAVETAPTAPPPPVEPIPALTATQKTRRKLNKIVIQPILPLETAAPLRKKPKTGKTTLTLEPLRPTTALPPVTGFAPKERKTGKTLLRTGQLSFGDFTETPVATPPATPASAPVAPITASRKIVPPPLPPLTAIPDEYASEIPLLKPWHRRIPREIIYAGTAMLLIVLCVIVSFVYLLSAHHATPPAPHVASPDSGSSPPSHAGTQFPNPSPKTADDFSNRGFARQNKGDLDGAIQDYNQALNLDPRNVEALYRRGLARQAKGDPDGALADYNQAIDLSPKQADAYSNRAFIKQGKNDMDGALADYTQALLLNPKIPRAYYNEGLIKVQKGDLDGAIADYNHALDLDPRMAIAYYNRGVAKNMEGNLDGAIADYTQAISLNPKIARAYCARGFARQSKGDADGALTDYSQALVLNPQLGDAFYNRALIKMQKGDLDGAVADNTAAINLDPKNAAPYSNRGLALFGKGNFDKAMADLRKFCELVPQDSNTDSARLYIWLISRQQDPKGHADQELSTALLNDWNSPPEDLISKIAAFLLGHMSESDLIANAASPDPSREPGQYCKVWYFAGMKRLVAGDTTTAITYFQKSLATNQKDLCEYIFSQAELKALGQDREVASKPGSGP